MKIAAISGSLRKQSTNTTLLNNLSTISTYPLEVNLINLNEIPLFNTDIDITPSAVASLERQLVAADAVVIATPEYNYSITGVLKNTLDWISAMRPNPLTNKAVSIMGVSVGNLGTVRAQMHLRDILFFMDSQVVNKPEILIGNSSQKFNAEGVLIDKSTISYINDNLITLYNTYTLLSK